MQKIVNSIVNFISKKSYIPKNELNAATKINNSHLVSSLMINELVVHLEKTFGIMIFPEEFTEQNFENVESLARLINAKKAS